MKDVLKALSVALVLAGTMVAQQEVAPDVYPDKSPATQQQAAQKKQPAQRKAVVAKKAAPKATLVAAHSAAKKPSTRSN